MLIISCYLVFARADGVRNKRLNKTVAQRHNLAVTAKSVIIG